MSEENKQLFPGDRCHLCGCYLTFEDNSSTGEGGWSFDELIYCKNPRCKSNRTGDKPNE